MMYLPKIVLLTFPREANSLYLLENSLYLLKNQHLKEIYCRSAQIKHLVSAQKCFESFRNLPDALLEGLRNLLGASSEVLDASKRFQTALINIKKYGVRWIYRLKIMIYTTYCYNKQVSHLVDG